MPNANQAKILVLSADVAQVSELSLVLQTMDLDVVCVPDSAEAIETIEAQQPALAVVDMGAFQTLAEGQSFSRRLKTEFRLPVIALLSSEALRDFDLTAGIDDFALQTGQPLEILIRVRHLLWKMGKIDSDNLIRHRDLVIDTVKFEVSIGGRLVDLSFKEYELLKVLLNNKGKVLTRQTLLDKVWGYDYYGGDRTVDVHIRRLRSKIEDAEHSFIQTVRNVGYKFKEFNIP